MFALCSKTLQAQRLLQNIVENCDELDKETVRNKSLLFVMLYDEIFGQGVRVFTRFLHIYYREEELWFEPFGKLKIKFLNIYRFK